LCPRDPGHKFHGEGRDAAIGNFLQRFRNSKRAKESHQHLSLAKERQIFRSVLVVRTVAKELHDDVRRAEDFPAIGRQFRAFFDVFLVGITGRLAGTSFEQYIEARFFQVGNHGRDQRDTPFFRINLSGYAKDHALSFHKTFELDAEIRLPVLDFVLRLRIRTLLSGCELQRCLFIDVLAESGAERVPQFWERLFSCIRNAPLG
jgi:hypothetical protein